MVCLYGPVSYNKVWLFEMKRERSTPQIISRTRFVVFSRSVVSDFFCDPHGLQPARLLCSWDFPGKNTGVGCHFLHPGDLPDPGVEPASPVLAGGFFTAEPPGKPSRQLAHCIQLLSEQIHVSKTVPSRAKQRTREETLCPLGLRTLSVKYQHKPPPDLGPRSQGSPPHTSPPGRGSLRVNSHL